MQKALKANPEIDLAYAHNDPMAHEAYLAARTTSTRAARIWNEHGDAARVA